MSEKAREQFEAPFFPEHIGEVGSRGLQRLAVVQAILRAPDGTEAVTGFLLQDWVTVQEDRYRYLATYESAHIHVRCVIGEYLACDVAWSIQE
jgi:hypothetical protein